MEIISYVQVKPRRSKFNFPVFEKKNLYTPELHKFAIPKVKTNVTPRNVITSIGRVISLVSSFIKDNFKTLTISLSILVLLTGCFVAGSYFYNQQKNFTGPLKMQEDDSLSIEKLNQLMASFALEGLTDYDEAGNLLDASIQNNNVNYTQPVTYQTYKVKSGDTISGIAKKFGLRSISTLISVNDIGNVRALAAGQKLRIPSIDGIVYVVQSGDTLDKIVKKYGINLNTLLDVNELTSETLTKGQNLFLPGASMDSKALKQALGDKFMIPIQAKFRWTSPYGKRIDPIANVASFHTGTDMACPTGTPIVASMSGKVITTGISRIYGNYVVIDHGNGYQTLYAHMSKIIAVKGQWVSQGTRIGLVGSTGYSTGPHLHFTVYKNGQMIDPMSVLK